MGTVISHGPELSLRRLQTVLRNDEASDGGVTALAVSGGLTLATHGDEFPAVRSLVLRKLMIDAAPPAKEDETLLFVGKAMLTGIEAGVAAYRKSTAG